MRSGRQALPSPGIKPRRRLLPRGDPRAGRLDLQRPQGADPAGRGDAHLAHRRRRDPGPAAGRVRRGELRGPDLCPAGQAQRVLPRQRLQLRAARRRSDRGVQGRRRVRHPLGPVREPAGTPVRPGRRRAGGAARGRPGQPAGQQLLLTRGVRVRQAHRGRGAHAGRELVLLPAAQARRDARRTRPNSRRSTTSTPRAWPTSGCTARPAAPSTCWPRWPPGTWCSSRTAGTARRSPPPATTCTTSTSWRARRRCAPGASATTRPTPGSAAPGRTSRWTPGCR